MSSRAEKQRTGSLPPVLNRVKRMLVVLLALPISLLLLWRIFLVLRDSQGPQGIMALAVVVWGVGGTILLFSVANGVIEQLSTPWKRRITPAVFCGPALAILAWYLLGPALRTFYLSLFDASSKRFVGLANYIYAFTNPSMLEAFRNNLLWLVLGTGSCVCLGLVIAVLADRAAPWFETLVKSLIFLPMAISLVGAGVIWKFMYEFRPAGAEQIGLLNAVVTALGGKPQAWTFNQPWNNLFLIVIMVWMQTGFAMVILSSAIKGVPEELLEAARIDGANEFQIFFHIVIPYIRGTIVTVSTGIVLVTLKVFDVVITMTGGNFGTEVIANHQYSMFRLPDYGRSSAIAVVLLVAVIPVIWYNLRQFSRQTEAF